MMDELTFKGVTYLPEHLPDQDLDLELLDELPKDLRKFYRRLPGLVAFHGGLHIRGCVISPDWHALRFVWKGEHALHLMYPQLSPEDIPFAQDCLGDQFFLRLDTVWILFAETGEIEDLEMDLDDFFSACIEDPVDFLSLEPLYLLMEQGQQLQPGYLIRTDPPLSMEADNYSLSTAPIKEQLDHLYRIYQSQPD